jgi:outer membrane murein-binding lipoprotein Lpp
MSLEMRLEKRIPLALIGAMLLQTMGALIWAGGAAERIAHAEAEASRVQELAERSVRLEAQSAAMRETLVRIEAKVDRLNSPR